jgi:hypothetical protein
MVWPLSYWPVYFPKLSRPGVTSQISHSSLVTDNELLTSDKIKEHEKEGRDNY